MEELHNGVVLIKYEPRSRCRSWDDVGPNKMETISGHSHTHHHSSLDNTSRSNTSTQSARSEDSWCSASDHDLSSDDESEKSNISIKSNCQLRNTLHKARTLCDRWRFQNMPVNNVDLLESPGNHGRLSRWFSIRRGSSHHYDVDSSDTVSLTSPVKTSQMPQLCEVDEENSAMVQFQCMQQRRQAPPTLPSPPPNLSPQQLKRRHIVAAIVHSENSYVSTLQRLVNDYKKPLEESSPPILSQSKIATLFHRLPEILQCHTLFRIALAECVRSWDKDEKLGDVFVASFSKAIVLDIYSGFINNFSVAMDLAKQESKRKTALADFFKVKQISAHDRLSFFGLMVKPVQRFPQFILFLQDLLKHTPQGHHDRMSLQLALTQLESLAEMLNERKREAEQFQAFKEMLRHVSGKLSHRPLSSTSRYLIREDNVTQMEFNQNGMITKSKRRRLLLLNDLVVCVSVTPRSTEDFSGNERLTLKWTYPVSDIEIQDTSTSPTLSRLLTAGLNKGGSLKSDKSGDCGQATDADNLCVEMNDLMHDYEVMSRISDLVAQLKGRYEELTLQTTKQILQSIQMSIQQKDEDMVWADSCCLQLVTKQGQMYTFQTESPLVKKDWITELRLAQLALDPNNSPSWEVPEQEQRPSTKMPLFVSSQAVYHSQHQTEVRCGCYYYIENSRPTKRRSRNQNYLWICTGDGVSSHVTIFGQSTTASTTCLKRITTFDLVETKVTAIEFVKGVSSDLTTLASDLVWMGTDSRKIMIYAATEPEKEEEIGSYPVSGPIIEIKYHCDNVFVALGTGLLLLFKRQVDGAWALKDPFAISLGSDPVSCLMPINMSVYAACGKKVWVLNATTGDILKNFSAQHEHVGNVKLMAHSGVGLWVALKNSSTVCLYHTETFKHLQDINIASNVLRVTKMNNSSNWCGGTIAANNQTAVTVTALLACKGLLWVGTNVGISLTIPLPRLEGVPIISGRVNISYHAHFGPITFLLAIQNTKNTMYSTKDHRVNDDESVQLRARDSEQKSRDRASLDSSVSSNIVKLKQQLTGSPIMLRRKRSKEYDCRGSKTLPRGLGAGCGFLSSSMSSSQSSGENCDVYGLYGELMYVKDYENENNSGIDPIYETLRRSDPELAAIPNKVSTLDRRLKMKITRPRSLDLSNWSVDSHASSLYTSSGSEENLSLKTGKLSRNSSIASRNGPYDLSATNNSVIQSALEATSTTNLKANGKKNGKTMQQIEQPKKTVLTLMGGRGYVNWRQLHAQFSIDKNSKSTYAFKDPNSNDAHIVLWEMKL
ncbi:rho guanine nucleotide exchange factor 10 isoform X4 [Ooceraea biroi]|uniref:rho guanine nucleotide exchange factor 10 isoform X4 n=1 Tax=Ooceraea biroi TaxID=2015173 RepID=UPI000F08CB77|nr:rho guanine nucleotide exchange factor 10 isoform X4 [Ooceraea biroi]